MPTYKILYGDNRAVMAKARSNGIDAIVTDPPYELGFMGKKWDGSGIAYDADVWAQALRVLKPGGYLLAFGGTRTYHRVACAIEDAGFIVRDCLQWLYGSGFPKSLDISKALDKAAGADRAVVGQRNAPVGSNPTGQGGGGWSAGVVQETLPATDLARQWDGWGTALKPAYEPILLAQKPLEGTYAANVAKWGCGALNIAGCRIGSEQRYNPPATFPAGGSSLNMSLVGMPQDAAGSVAVGRWPANVLLDNDAAAVLDAQSGTTRSGKSAKQHDAYPGDNVTGLLRGNSSPDNQYSDSGGASRFFYVAKASRADRDYGCDGLPAKTGGEATDREDGSAGVNNPRAGAGRTGGARNFHPTVKPTALMRQLVRLVTPPGGTVLDPFAGSGSTGIACGLEGFGFVGIELTPDYWPILEARLARAYAVGVPAEMAAD